MLPRAGNQSLSYFHSTCPNHLNLLCFLRRGTTISPHSSDNCTGWRRWSKSSSSLPSLFTSVGSGQRHRTSSKNYASRQTLRLDVVCGQPHHHHWLSAVRCCLPSAIVLFRSLPHVFGTVCRRARHVCTLAACFSQSSEDAPLQTLLSVTPSSVFFVVPVKWLVIIGHVNRSFYFTYFTWGH